MRCSHSISFLRSGVSVYPYIPASLVKKGKKENSTDDSSLSGTNSQFIASQLGTSQFSLCRSRGRTGHRRQEGPSPKDTKEHGGIHSDLGK